MSSTKLESLVAFGRAADFDSLLVTRRGKIVTEAYYAPFQKGQTHALNSATKSVVGIITGIAIRSGLLDTVDHPVLDFFRDRKITGGDAHKQAMTIKHLLDMTSGLDWTEPLTGIPETALQMGNSRDRVQFVLDRPMAQPPGKGFNYNSGSSHLLSAILTRVLGRNAFDFAQEKLFPPLGIADAIWESDPQENSLGGRGLHLQPRDMAKIGYLCLKGGQWDGAQLLPPSWISEITNATFQMHLLGRLDFRYANLFWTLPARHAYMAVGFNSQIILVLPRLEIVAVATGRAPPPFSKLIEGIVQSVKTDENELS